MSRRIRNLGRLTCCWATGSTVRVVSLSTLRFILNSMCDGAVLGLDAAEPIVDDFLDRIGICGDRGEHNPPSPVYPIPE